MEKTISNRGFPKERRSPNLLWNLPTKDMDVFHDAMDEKMRNKTDNRKKSTIKTDKEKGRAEMRKEER